MDLSKSADAVLNAKIIHCYSLSQRRVYAVCIHLMQLSSESKLGAAHSVCDRAICGGYCDAIKLRKEEIKEGRSIYFEERAKFGSAFRLEGAIPTSHEKKKVIKAPLSKSSVIDTMDVSSYESVINEFHSQEQQ